ncbi:prefoldin subunit alpha [Methanoplanus endosymbiosus]|uniref:Prefoldin subunit alpha n=1 Tax=Methanoplanus endosymbiosus TaxID=33865 RepID=A0A9E7PM83_9EURY|nr:prefoldin subunit alpha [Methanoplanus endosymbiosus]UUX92763.1 prefoldin subunit alpha [Methanoplanus endosymbiosus]
MSKLDAVDPREVQMLKQYLNEISKEAEAYSSQLQILESRRLESVSAIETLNSFSESPDSTVLLQIGGGASVRVKIEEPEKVLLNIGSDVIVEKNCQDSCTYLNDRVKELEVLEKKLSAALEQLNRQAGDIAKKMEASYKQLQAENADF